MVGSIGLKFTNFAIQNLFHKKAYRIVPQGEGQTFSINARTNGVYYTSASLSFLEPWLGGKRPNSLSVNLFFAWHSPNGCMAFANVRSAVQEAARCNHSKGYTVFLP